MNIVLIGGAGFIGTNLAIKLSANNDVTIVDGDSRFFEPIRSVLPNIKFVEAPFSENTDFDKLLIGQDIVYHLASTVIPGNSNKDIAAELGANVLVTCRLLDACVRQEVKKVVFISSGGAVYGKKGQCPLTEDTATYPISSYGIQKISIEKLLYLYRYQLGLDYRIIRLANPYGPYQRPNGKLGVVTTFVYRALTDGRLEVYGDGTVVRDFIYIDDAVKGIINITEGDSELRTFNLGSGYGTSINQLIEAVKKNVRNDLKVEYIAGRVTDVPVNYLDIGRYEKVFGNLNPISLDEGIIRTKKFMENAGIVK